MNSSDSDDDVDERVILRLSALEKIPIAEARAMLQADPDIVVVRELMRAIAATARSSEQSADDR